MVCIDSDIIIEFLRNKESGVKTIRKIKQEDRELLTTSINSFEVLKGIQDSPHEKQEGTKSFLSKFKILEFDFEVSEEAAQIFETLKKEGQPIELADIMIASIAIKNNEPLLTENKKHFKRMEKFGLILNN
ncbi:MAG: type II toxin-antitoxin system VapC family toxin [Candidatus Pacearchaeota archaeon]